MGGTAHGFMCFHEHLYARIWFLLWTNCGWHRSSVMENLLVPDQAGCCSQSASPGLTVVASSFVKPAAGVRLVPKPEDSGKQLSSPPGELQHTGTEPASASVIRASVPDYHQILKALEYPGCDDLSSRLSKDRFKSLKPHCPSVHWQFVETVTCM